MYINKEKKCVEIFDAHWYKVDDDFYPSVSAVLQTIAKGVGYENWLKSVGHNAKIIVEEAQASGSKIHQTIEKQFLQGLEITPEGFNECEWIKMCNFTNWFNELNEDAGIEIEEIETEVFNKKLRIAGTADLICKIGGVRYLLDWKSGNNIYATSDLQVAAYIKMWNDLNPDKKIEKGAIVHIGANNKTKKDYSNKGVKFEPVEIVKSTKLFLHALAIFDDMFRKNAPMLEYPMTLQMKEKIK